VTDDDVTYYAVHDPADPSRITYWRETAQGRKPWPNKANYAPVLLKRDVPALLTRQDRRAWVNAWFREELPKWQAAIDAAIDADPVGARARFVAFTSRCCCCAVHSQTRPASATASDPSAVPTSPPACWPSSPWRWGERTRRTSRGRRQSMRATDPAPRRRTQLADCPSCGGGGKDCDRAHWLRGARCCDRCSGPHPWQRVTP